MFIVLEKKRIIAIICVIALGFCAAVSGIARNAMPASGDYIKWVDFTPTAEVLKQAAALDIKSHESDTPVSWIELLAYAACKNGGNFKKSKGKYVRELYERVSDAQDIDTITADMKYYTYFYEAYSAVLSGYIGYDDDGNYGVLVYNPIGAGYYYSHYDDFGASRSYGYKRKHLGHDMMGSVGTPIVAVEGGTVEALGWNQYGGWRIGIRSADNKRYYYYAHLRKNKPFAQGLEQGMTVKSGQLIGYLGMTGYSSTENVNNINVPHLHFGIQLIFDESQKDGINQIWIDCYQIVRFLENYRSKNA